jgi:anti-sigma-K factor RskA
MEALSPAESRTVEAWAAQYPEIQIELRRIQEALSQYARSFELAPRPELKREILSKVQDKPAPPLPVATPTRPNRLGWIGLLLALLAIVAVVVLYNRSRQLEKTVQRVVAEKDSLQQDYNRAINNLELIQNPTTKIIALTPPPDDDTPIAPDAEVTLYWNQNDRTPLLAIKNLPEPPAGKKYQLWTIRGTQAPTPAGMIDFDSTTFQTMPQVAEVDVFAITLEDAGGSPVPTSKIYVAGKVI